mgnify:CR=1 FL=1
MTESIEINNDDRNVYSYNRLGNSGNFLQIGNRNFDNLFSSAISESVDVEVEDELYTYKEGKYEFSGDC